MSPCNDMREFRCTTCGTRGYLRNSNGLPREYTQYEAEAIASETILYWRVRGITATEAWNSLGHRNNTQTSWAPIRSFMIRWLLTQDAECPVVKQAA